MASMLGLYTALKPQAVGLLYSKKDIDLAETRHIDTVKLRPTTYRKINLRLKCFIFLVPEYTYFNLISIERDSVRSTS